MYLVYMYTKFLSVIGIAMVIIFDKIAKKMGQGGVM